MMGSFATFAGLAIFTFWLKMLPFASWNVIRDYWKWILLAGFFYGASSALEGVAIQFTTLSLNQTIKSTTPFVTISCGYLFQNKR